MYADHALYRHALATLEIGNLSCIPVHKGADYPLLNTPELFQTVSGSQRQLRDSLCFNARKRSTVDAMLEV